VYKKSGHKDVELKEVGPRFELRCTLYATVHVWYKILLE